MASVYSEYKVPALDKQNTIEKVVGELNGKLVYEQTLSGTLPDYNSTDTGQGNYLLKSNVTGINLVNISGWCRLSAKTVVTIPYIVLLGEDTAARGACSVVYFSGTGQLIMAIRPIATNYKGFPYSVTIRYTKN